jgi:rubredoxin
MKRSQDEVSVTDVLRTLEEAGRAEHEGRSRAERKRGSRLTLLPANRRCPVCDVVKIESRKWVILEDGETAICRSCWMKG